MVHFSSAFPVQRAYSIVYLVDSNFQTVVCAYRRPILEYGAAKMRAAIGLCPQRPGHFHAHRRHSAADANARPEASGTPSESPKPSLRDLHAAPWIRRLDQLRRRITKIYHCWKDDNGERLMEGSTGNLVLKSTIATKLKRNYSSSSGARALSV